MRNGIINEILFSIFKQEWSTLGNSYPLDMVGLNRTCQFLNRPGCII